MSKLNAGKVSLFALTAISFLAVFILGKSVASVSATQPTPTPDPCNQETTYSIDEDDDSHFTFAESSNRVDIDFNGGSDDRDQAVIEAGAGYSLITVEWDSQTSGESFTSVTVVNPITTINTAGNSDATRIDEVRVKVKKICSTPTPTPTATPEGKIDWCHCEPSGGCQSLNLPPSALQNAGHMNASGNPLHAGDHAGQCTQPTATPSCTPTATSTPRPTPDPCGDGQCATPTPAPEATPLTCGGDQHLDAGGVNCVTYAVPGEQVGGPGGQVLGASTGKVLGANTMAKTGSFAENLNLATIALGSIMTIGGTLSALGIKNFKKASKKA